MSVDRFLNMAKHVAATQSFQANESYVHDFNGNRAMQGYSTGDADNNRDNKDNNRHPQILDMVSVLR